MSKFVGRRGTFGAAKEASRGVAVGTPTFWIPRGTVSFDDKIEGQRQDLGVGRIADSDAWFVTQKMGSGEVETDLEDRTIGIILTSLLGASPVKTGANPYTYTYTLSQSNQHQSLSLLYQDPDYTEVYPLAVVNSLNIVIEQNAIVKATISFMSRVGRSWTTQTADFTALGLKFLHQHLVFKLADTVGALGAATAINLKRLELTIESNAQFDSVLGTVEPEDILNHQYSVSGSLQLSKQDETYRGYMLGNTYKAMDISLIRSTSSSLQFQLPRVDFSEWEQDRSLNEIVSQEIQFKGNYDLANALDIISTCVLVNNLNTSNY
jgi:hypothetical protein